MKAVIDTNVFVSGIFWKGPPYKVLQAWKNERFKLVITTSILDEYRRVLSGLSKRYGGISYERILDLVSLYADVTSEIPFAQPVCKDTDDDKFLAAALSANASYVVTGDNALLELNGFRKLHVVRPTVFLKQL